MPPVLTRVLLWNGVSTWVDRLVHCSNDRRETRQTGFESGKEPTNWAPLPDFDDPRWKCEYQCRSAPWEVDVLGRSWRKNDRSFWVNVDCKRDNPFPGFAGNPGPLNWADAWMHLDVAKRDAMEIPTSWLKKPKYFDVLNAERLLTVKAEAENLFLSAINDGDLYRTVFAPLTRGEALNHRRYKVRLSDFTSTARAGGIPRSSLLRGYVYAVLLRFAAKNDLCGDYSIRSAAAHAAVDDVVTYYQQHAAELVTN